MVDVLKRFKKLSVAIRQKKNDVLEGITLLIAIPFLLDDPGGHYGGHDHHHDEKEFEAFKKKFEPKYQKNLKDAQDIKFAHSRAHEAAELAIDKNYEGLVKEGDEGDKLRDLYKTTLRDTLKGEIVDRFGEKYGILLDPKADDNITDQLFESLGVPKMDDLDKLLSTMDKYDPSDVESELSGYQRAFLQQHMGNLPAKYARKSADKHHIIKWLDLDDDVDAEFVNEDDLRRIISTHLQNGGVVPKSQLRKEIRKKRGSKGHGGTGHH